MGSSSFIPVLVPLASLLHILRDVLTLKLPHALNLVQVDDEALIIRMVLLDALSAKDRFVVRAIEMHNTLWMLTAKLISHTSLVLIIKIKITRC